MLARLRRLTNKQASIILIAAGLLTYFDSLQNQFSGDDIPQIVNNIPVHSLTHWKLFFDGGTFYVGQGLVPLIGTYYRPLQTTVYSLIYTLVGPQPNFFHLVQLSIAIASSILVFLIFRRFSKAYIALFLALVFLIHPIDSQVVFSIASLQDALFFFFGILGFYLLIKYTSHRSMVAACACIFLSLLAKETAILFIAMSLLYLYWYNRKRLKYYLVYVMVPLIVYIILRIHAVGVLAKSTNAPIDRVDLVARLYTAPSIFLLYVSKLLFPWTLHSWYYWVYPNFSFRYVLLPLLLDLCFVAGIVWWANYIHRHTDKNTFVSFIYFAIWYAVGLVMILQIIPLDMTACETWFYFSMMGFLGMIGLTIKCLTEKKKIRMEQVVLVMVLIVVCLGIRTVVRGTDWTNDYNIALHNLVAGKGDFQTDNQLASYYYSQSQYYVASSYAKASVASFPYATNENVLGAVDTQLGEYRAASMAFTKGLTYVKLCSIYDNFSILTSVYGQTQSNIKLLSTAIQRCPNDAVPWLFLAVLEYQLGNRAAATFSIAQSYKYYSPSINLPIPQAYTRILTGQPVKLSL